MTMEAGQTGRRKVMHRLTTFVGVISLGLLAGCSRSPVWVERETPTTEQERKAVAEMIVKILAATPATLSGHDQDWDDAIAEARRTAGATLCRKTYWERAPVYPYQDVWDYTGRWRYAENVQVTARGEGQ
jgi:hypothetical protein